MIIVQAPREEVEAALRAELPAESLAQLKLEAAEPAEGGDRIEGEILATAVKFVLSAVGGGIIYDALKTQVLEILRRVFPGKVEDDDD